MRAMYGRNELFAWLDHLAGVIPGQAGVLSRRWYYSLRFKKLGGNSSISTDMILYEPGNISIGSNFAALRGCSLAAIDGELIIGDHVNLAESVRINASQQGRIVIGNDVAIAPNTVLRSSDHIVWDANTLIRLQ